MHPAAGHHNDRVIAKEVGFYLTAETLRNVLAGPAETPPDTALSQYLRANLRVSGGAPAVGER